jgi:hypothetical protein
MPKLVYSTDVSQAVAAIDRLNKIAGDGTALCETTKEPLR